MAVVLVFRVGIALTPGVIRAYQTVQGPGLSQWESTFNWIRDRFVDPEESDEDLSRDASQHAGYTVVVATYSGDFETRRVQFEWSLTGPNVLDEDIRVCTFHLVKLVGGLPSADWLQADFDQATAAFNSWWGNLKEWYNSGLVHSGLKFYKEGPNIVPPQPPVFEAAITPTPGTSAERSLPPQLALSVTEQAGSKKNWGRFYLPAPALANTTGAFTNTAAGRPDTAWMTDVADTTDGLYQGLASNSLPVVIYRAKLEAGRPHQGETPLPERPANAQTVEQIQVDDVWDVVRSRRYETAMLRIQRAIGS